MEFKETDGFSTTRVAGDRPRSELLWRGQPTGVQVDGVSLDHQWKAGDGYLLFLTEDSPFEEGLHIYLLGPDRQLRDALELAAPYAPGSMQVVAVEDGISFSFFGDDRWRLEVHATPQGPIAGRVTAPAKRKPGMPAKRLVTLRRSR